MIKAAILIVFTIINISHAHWDAERIEKGKWIKHGINAAVYLCIVYVPYHFFNDWWLVGLLLVNRLIAFNIALNLYRDLPFDYVPKKPAAITDKIAFFVFGKNGTLMYAVYLGIFILLFCKVFLW